MRAKFLLSVGSGELRVRGSGRGVDDPSAGAESLLRQGSCPVPAGTGRREGLRQGRALRPPGPFPTPPPPAVQGPVPRGGCYGADPAQPGRRGWEALGGPERTWAGERSHRRLGDILLGGHSVPLGRWQGGGPCPGWATWRPPQVSGRDPHPHPRDFAPLGLLLKDLRNSLPIVRRREPGGRPRGFFGVSEG